MSATEPLPFMPNREELQRLLDSRVDPDAERFRYFGTILMNWASDPANESPAGRTLRLIMDEHKPTTLEGLRACIDAAARLACVPPSN